MTKLLIWLWLAQAGDISTTCYALRHGAVEANPVLPRSCEGIAAAKLAIAAGVTAYALHTKTRGMRWVVGIGATSGSVGVVWNVWQLAQ